MRTVAFIPVRLSSTRLPEKQFKIIGDKMLLDWIIDELRGSRELDEIVITTHADSKNLKLIDYAVRKGVKLFWYCGDEDDVTGRLCSAAKSYDARICVLVSGDCPLVSHEVVDLLVKTLKNSARGDVVIAKKNVLNRYPFVEGIIVATICAWKRADSISKATELKMHQFPVLFLCRHLFEEVPAELPLEYHSVKHRFSVDTYSDLIFMNTIYNYLKKRNLEFNSKNAIKLLDEIPEIMTINANVRQRALNELEKRFLILVRSELSEDELKYYANLFHFLVDTRGWAGAIHLYGQPKDIGSYYHAFENEGIRILTGTELDVTRYDIIYIEEGLKKYLTIDMKKRLIPISNHIRPYEWSKLAESGNYF